MINGSSSVMEKSLNIVRFPFVIHAGVTLQHTLFSKSTSLDDQHQRHLTPSPDNVIASLTG